MATYDLDEALQGGNKKGRFITTAVTLICDIGLGIGGYFVAKHLGVSNITAYLISCIGPLISAIISFIRSSKVSAVSVGIIALQLFSIALTLLIGSNEKLVLYKDCFISGGISLALIGSVFFVRPLLFLIFQRFSSDGTPEGIALWDKLLTYEAFGHCMKRLTLLWGVILGVEAIFKALIISKTSFSFGFTATQIIPLGFTVFGAICTGVMITKMREELKKYDRAQGIIPAE